MTNFNGLKMVVFEFLNYRRRTAKVNTLIVYLTFSGALLVEDRLIGLAFAGRKDRNQVEHDLSQLVVAERVQALG